MSASQMVDGRCKSAWPFKHTLAPTCDVPRAAKAIATVIHVGAVAAKSIAKAIHAGTAGGAVVALAGGRSVVGIVRGRISALVVGGLPVATVACRGVPASVWSMQLCIGDFYVTYIDTTTLILSSPTPPSYSLINELQLFKAIGVSRS